MKHWPTWLPSTPFEWVGYILAFAVFDVLLISALILFT